MSDWDLAVRTEDGIASVDLNRPEAGNALTQAMMGRLSERLASIGGSREIRTVAIWARGADFCVGRDDSGEVIGGPTRLTRAILDVYATIAQVPVPVVACVQGSALGIGAALAAACDVTLVSDAARFAFPEIERNIPPVLAIGAAMRSVPLKALSYLVYSAEELDARAAVACGLASRAFPAPTFEVDATAFLRALAARPRLVLETIKRFQAKAATLNAEMVSEYAGALLALVRSSISDGL